MTRVVRKQIQHRIDQQATSDDQTVLIGQCRGAAERAFFGMVRVGGGLALAADIRHPMWCPESAEQIGHPDNVRLLVLTHAGPSPLTTASCGAVGDSLACECAYATMSSIASSADTPLRCDPSRYRNDTASCATSSSPAINKYGTFCLVWVRIFFCIRSDESSNSARMPRAFSRCTTEFK